MSPVERRRTPVKVIVNPTPVILGLDAQMPGIGFGVLDARNGEALLAGWTAIERDGWYETNAHAALSNARVVERGWRIAQVVVERVGGGKGIQSMLRVADAAGIVAGIATVIWPDAPLWRPTPGEWKKGSGLKGNASKDDVRALALDLYPEGEEVRQDGLDALLMAYAAYRANVEAIS